MLTEWRQADGSGEEGGRERESSEGLNRIVPFDFLPFFLENIIAMPRYIRSRRTAFGRDGHPALCCNPDGRIEANRFGPAQQWEEMEISTHERDSGDTFATIRTWTGKYISVTADGVVSATSDDIGEQEQWTMQLNADGFTTFKSWHGAYLSCRGGWFQVGHKAGVMALDQEWEHWLVLDRPRSMTFPGSTAQTAVCALNEIGDRAGVCAVGGAAKIGALITSAIFGVPSGSYVQNTE